jgi:predicted peptidase
LIKTFTLLMTAAAVISLCDSDADGADAKEVFRARIFQAPSGRPLPYRLLEPKGYDSKKKYPLVLFLHGAGERGEDNAIQLVHGMNDFAQDENREKYPCFVVAPQCPNGKQWVDVPWTAESHTQPENPSESLQDTLDLIAALRQEVSIDSRRLYVTGLSMGGFGTWDLAQRHPELFAAAAPICAGGDEQQAARLAKLPIWAFHGDVDTVVKPSRSRNMIAAIKAVGGQPLYTEYPGVGHNSWAQTYRDPKLFEWLFAQKRGAD